MPHIRQMGVQQESELSLFHRSNRTAVTLVGPRARGKTAFGEARCLLRPVETDRSEITPDLLRRRDFDRSFRDSVGLGGEAFGRGLHGRLEILAQRLRIGFVLLEGRTLEAGFD